MSTPDFDPKGYYRALGVGREASRGAIRQAYRRRARALHPDATADTMAMPAFRLLNEAYRVLSDPAQRAAYDALARGRLARGLVLLRTGDAGGLPRSLLAAGLLLALAAAIGFAAGALTRLGPGGAAHELPGAPSVAGPATGGDPAAPSPIDLRHAAAAAPLYPTPEAGEALALLPQYATVVALDEAEAGWVRVLDPADRVGFVRAERLRPGSGVTALHAACGTDAASPRPSSGTVLYRAGSGPHALRLRSALAQDALVKLKDGSGATVLAAYVRAGDAAEVVQVPEGTFAVLYSSGRRYAAACGLFLSEARFGALRAPRRFALRRQEGAPLRTLLEVTLNDPGRPVGHRDDLAYARFVED